MNEPTIRKYAMASSVKNPEMRVPMGVRFVALCAVLMFANLPDGRLRFFKRHKNLARRAFVLCRRLFIQRAKDRFDDQLVLLSARCMNTDGTLIDRLSL